MEPGFLPLSGTHSSTIGLMCDLYMFVFMFAMYILVPAFPFSTFIITYSDNIKWLRLEK